MNLSRRGLLKASLLSSTAMTSGLTWSTGNSSSDFDVKRVLDEATQLLIQSYPETATSAGIDTGKYAGLKFKLSDRTFAGQEKIKATTKDVLSKLNSLDRQNMSAEQALDVNVVRSVFELASSGFDQPYGDMAMLNYNWSYRPSPYVIAQNTGAFVEIPSFLDSSHSVKSQEDVDAYLMRMRAYASQLDGETQRAQMDAEQGVILPDFLMKKVLAQLKTTVKKPASEWGLVTSIVAKGQAFEPKVQKIAERIVNEQVKPALQKQHDTLLAAAKNATSDAGVWAKPKGDDYYAWALQAGTTTTMTPDEVHEMGLDELASLHARMDPILKSIGYKEGSVGQRMVALAKDPRYHFAPGDEGRAEIMQFIEDTVADIRKRMPQAFETLVPGFLEVTRISPEVEDGAPGAYGGAGSIDGTKPGHFWINLRTTSLHNKYSLPDLTYHEAIPGHVWQGEYTFKQSLLRSLLAFNAYSEGWALYAEQIADEVGVYDTFPVGRLGYLQSLAFRACRLVVDTGLHAKRWSRQQAIDWFVTNNGSNPDEVQSEVDRYCAWPGQACGYKVGHSAIQRLRDKAKIELGDRFDYRKFNDALVLGGAVPITVLESVVDAYIARSKV